MLAQRAAAVSESFAAAAESFAVSHYFFTAKGLPFATTDYFLAPPGRCIVPIRQPFPPTNYSLLTTDYPFAPLASENGSQI